ncbi:MAG: Ribosomal protein S12 methylthiotransferase RimO [Firmicutes bacterium ADurb.Bin248]|nr:MAG: Ribosomal protein S12 methylthiotransferase RimO [Firmicutes bacterium ADurb.Bin248]HPK14995.1 30S ribosomal protein S12 methylthiotransferase RimO [Clostridia bacterium]
MRTERLRAGVISLGCSKNRVDSEKILACLRDAGFEITNDETRADAVVVNTCGFIEPAKQESINAILEAARSRKPGGVLAVAGCLSQRYLKELSEELPEADILHGVGDHEGLVEKIRQKLGQTGAVRYCGSRVLTTPAYSAYLRIADGCDNRCTYCAIPLIRGGRRSVLADELVNEARSLAQRGVKEITLIAQDTSAYGLELYGRPSLAELLGKIAAIDELHWVRVLYAYPNTVDERLVDAMLGSEKIVKYIDMPIQHIDPQILSRMNRHGSAEHIRRIVDYIRRASPEFILRTTVMTGFPGETEEQFDRLAEFLREHPFDRLGAFAFSPEDGTAAADFPGRIDEDTAKRRLDAIMRAQREISRRRNERRVGREYEALIEDITNGVALCRSYAEAPEVDGKIAVSGVPEGTSPGDFIRTRIVAAGAYDLKGVYL